MKAFAKFMMCAAVLMSSVVFSSCSKEEEKSDDRDLIEEGLLATHKFFVTPDVLKFVDVTVEFTDFDGNTTKETLTSDKVLIEKEFITPNLTASTEFNVTIERNGVEIEKGEYDIAVMYEFSAIKLVKGSGVPLYTGRPYKPLTEKWVDISEKFTKTVINRLPEETSITHCFTDFGGYVVHDFVVEE